MDNTSGDENPYRELTVNNAGKIETTLSHMWNNAQYLVM